MGFLAIPFFYSGLVHSILQVLQRATFRRMQARVPGARCSNSLLHLTHRNATLKCRSPRTTKWSRYSCPSVWMIRSTKAQVLANNRRSIEREVQRPPASRLDGQKHEKKRVPQALCCDDLLRHEVALPQCGRVNLDELVPRAVPALRPRVVAVLLEDVLDRIPRDGEDASVTLGYSLSRASESTCESAHRSADVQPCLGGASSSCCPPESSGATCQDERS